MSTQQSATGRFRIGDRVVVRERFPAGHIRTPFYIRGKRGIDLIFKRIELWPCNLTFFGAHLAKLAHGKADLALFAHGAHQIY